MKWWLGSWKAVLFIPLWPLAKLYPHIIIRTTIFWLGASLAISPNFHCNWMIVTHLIQTISWKIPCKILLTASCEYQPVLVWLFQFERNNFSPVLAQIWAPEKNTGPVEQVDTSDWSGSGSSHCFHHSSRLLAIYLCSMYSTALFSEIFSAQNFRQRI